MKITVCEIPGYSDFESKQAERAVWSSLIRA